MDKKYPDTKNIDIPEKMLAKWQEIVNILAEIMNVPAALIMRTFPPEIEVFVTSDTEENPYEVGHREKILGLYCEEVITNDKELLVADARKISRWKNNPDIKLGMISYLGYPLRWPDGDLFGTICVLDSKKNKYSELFKKTLFQFKELIESHLELIFQHRKVEIEKEKAEQYLEAAGPIVVILNEKGKIKRINERGCSILDCKKKEIEGKDWFENFIPEQIRKNVKKVFERLISGNTEEGEFEEHPVITGKGYEKIILWYNSIIKNEKEEIVGTISSGIDITESKEAQENLRKSEE
ncbi:MAG: PAS domain S-box protein, partial [candidate division WOR-3 bacterium]